MFIAIKPISMIAKPYLTMFSHDYAEDIINFHITAFAKDSCIITITNDTGKIINVAGLNLIEGINKIDFHEMKALAKGYYMINVRTISEVYLFSSKIRK
jgi:hypothetical protein